MPALNPDPSLCHPSAAALQDRADGQALPEGAGRLALTQALQQLRLAEAHIDTGPARTAGLCQALKAVAAALCTLKAYSAAQGYLAQAQRWATVLGATDLRADLQCTLAEVATSAAEQALAMGAGPVPLRPALARCRELAFEAARLALLTTDPHWELRLLLRASDVLDRCGEHHDAAQLQRQALVLIGRHNQALDDHINPTLPAPLDGWRNTAPGPLM